MRLGRLVRPKTHLCALVLGVVMLAAGANLLSCAQPSPRVEPAQPRASAQAGDSALPEFDGDEYAYILANVLSKDADADSIQIEVERWGDDRPFSKSPLAAGSIGAVSCSELVFFPAGIGDGSTVVVCCSVTDDEFPVTAYAIEKLDLFEERVDRWSAA